MISDRIYLDFNAGTPLAPEVAEVMAAIHFSLGRTTTFQELEAVVHLLRNVVPCVD